MTKISFEQYINTIGDPRVLGFLTRTRLDYAVSIPFDFIDFCDGKHSWAAILSRIVFWHGVNVETWMPRLTYFEDGHFWLVKQYDDWNDECRVKKETSERALHWLHEKNVIEYKVQKSPFHSGEKACFIRLKWDTFFETFLTPKDQNDPLVGDQKIKMISSIYTNNLSTGNNPIQTAKGGSHGRQRNPLGSPVNAGGSPPVDKTNKLFNPEDYPDYPGLVDLVGFIESKIFPHIKSLKPNARKVTASMVDMLLQDQGFSVEIGGQIEEFEASPEKLMRIKDQAFGAFLERLSASYARHGQGNRSKAIKAVLNFAVDKEFLHGFPKTELERRSKKRRRQAD